MVGKEVVEGNSELSTLQEGAGEIGPLKPKGNFEQAPHRGPVCKNCRQDFYYDYGDSYNADFIKSGCCVNCYEPSSWSNHT